MAFGIVIASLLLAWATYRFIEGPVRFSSNRVRAHSDCRGLRRRAWCLWLGGVGHRWCAATFSRQPRSGKDERATLDETYAPTNGMNVLEYNSRGYPMVAQIGQGARKVALAGNSAMFHYVPRFAATRRRRCG